MSVSTLTRQKFCQFQSAQQERDTLKEEREALLDAYEVELNPKP